MTFCICWFVFSILGQPFALSPPLCYRPKKSLVFGLFSFSVAVRMEQRLLNSFHKELKLEVAVHLFEFILLRVCWVSWKYRLIFSSIMEYFIHYFFKHFFTPFLFLLLGLLLYIYICTLNSIYKSLRFCYILYFFCSDPQSEESQLIYFKFVDSFFLQVRFDLVIFILGNFLFSYYIFQLQNLYLVFKYNLHHFIYTLFCKIVLSYLNLIICMLSFSYWNIFILDILKSLYPLRDSSYLLILFCVYVWYLIVSVCFMIFF